MSIWIVLQQWETDGPSVFEHSYESMHKAREAIRNEWLTDFNIRDHNLRVIDDFGTGYEFAMGDSDDGVLTLTAIEIDKES